MGYEYHLDSALVKPTREMAQTSGFDPTTQVKTCFDCKMFDVANWVASLNGENGPRGTPSHEALSVSSQGALECSPPRLDGYRTAIVDTLGPTAHHIAHNADLHRFFSSFHRDRPKSSRNLPKWNLSVVLNELTKAEKMVPEGRLHMRPFQFHLKEHWRYPQSLDNLLSLTDSTAAHLDWWQNPST